MSQEEITPIYAPLTEIRQRLAHCKSCEQRREIIQRWLHGEKAKMGMINLVPPAEPPRDMSVLMKEK